jgi:hypothetical protein
MTSAGRDATIVPQAGGGPARRPRAAGRGHRAAKRLIVLATVVHMLRSRRFYAWVISVAIALGALGRIGQENQASSRARLAAWDKRQIQRLERKAKAQGRAVRGAGQMMRSGAPGHLAAKRNKT